MPGRKKKSKSPKRSPGSSPKGKKGKRGGSKSPKSSKSKSPRHKRKDKKEKLPVEEPVEEPPPVQEQRQVPEPPPGVVPLFLTTQTQEIFNLLPDVGVTREVPNAMVAKLAVLDDMKQRKAVSDFSPIKEQIEEYPADEILVVWDSEFVYGENYFVCVTEEAKESILYFMEDEEEEEEEDDPFALPDIPYIPPESKPWIALGSDVEVLNEQVHETRAKVQLSISQPRRYFGQKYLFSNRDATGAKDSYQECLPNPEKRRVICKRELDKGVQAVPEAKMCHIQTDYLKPLRQWCQYDARQFSEEDKVDLLESERMHKFIKDSAPMMESALQQNEIINVFRNDWMSLNPGTSLMTQQHETYLKEYQSFQDLHYSKDKQIISDDWHATIPGLVGVSCVERMTFDSRMRNLSRINLNSSLVLLWNYQDPIHPRLLLETPDDCFIFRFNPVNPNLVAGGCMSGRIVLWDLTEYYGRLAMTESAMQIKKLDFLSNLVEDTEGKIPTVEPVAMSNTDFGHSMCVTDIQWLLPPNIIDKNGRVMEEGRVQNIDEECHQFLSCAGDDCFFVWDITLHEKRRGHHTELPPIGHPDHWLGLASNWRPVVKVFLPFRADGTQYSLSQFRIWYRPSEIMSEGDGEGEEEEVAEESAAKPVEDAPAVPVGELEEYGGGKSPINVFAGTEAGEVIFADFRMKIDSNTKQTTFCEIDMLQVHAGPVHALCISTFFDDMVLTVGGFRFAVWKVNVKKNPLMLSAEAPARRMSGAWSLTRPSVFFIGREDGMIEAWDILDRAQEALLTQSLSGVEVTSLNLRKLGRRQVLSVSDSTGNLHLLEVPLLLTQVESDELNMLENLFKREAQREEEGQRKRQAVRRPTEEAVSTKPALGQLPQQKDAAEPPPDSEDDKMRNFFEDYEFVEKQALDKLLGRVSEEIPTEEVFEN